MGNRRDARRAARLAARTQPAPPHIGAPAERPSGTLEFYVDDEGLWRWRFVAENHRIVADSGQGYKTRRNAVKGWMVVHEARRYRTVGLEL